MLMTIVPGRPGTEHGSVEVQGQQVLKRLIDGRLTFEPTADGDERYSTFSGSGTVEPLLAGQVVQKLASPTGLDQVDRISGRFRRVRNYVKINTLCDISEAHAESAASVCSKTRSLLT